jgi:DNA modification methylase
MVSTGERQQLMVAPVRTELVWEGKYDEQGKLRPVERIALPFQTIEVINEPRERTLFSRARSEIDGWRNKLIWGDNKYIMASVLEEFASKVDLIYIDPPFATGDDFSFRVKVGDVEIAKQPSIIEQKAYNDTWGGGLDSYLQMLYERLLLMRDLLTEEGSIFIHIGTNVAHYVGTIADEVFGRANRRNQIAVKRITKNLQRQFDTVQALPEGYDVLFWYSNTPTARFKPIYLNQVPTHPQGYWKDFWSTADRPTMRYELLGVTPTSGQWKWSRERARKAVQNYEQYLSDEQSKSISLLDYWLEHNKELEFIRKSPTGKVEHWVAPLQTKFADTLWMDISAYSFTTGYNTEKSTQLLDRIVRNLSGEGDLVADFFCGSGTTMVVAEKLGRRWIGCDLSRFAIQVARKRLLDIPDCKPFEVLNLGKYERQYWQMNIMNGRQKDGQRAIFEYLEFIVKLYQAQPVTGFAHLHGRKAGRMVHVGAVDAPVTFTEVRAALQECQANGLKALDVLGWEWEMGLNDLVKGEAANIGIDLRLLVIPREVMDRRAVEAGDVHFYELAHLELEVKQNKGVVTIFLKNFAIPSPELIPPDVRDKIKHWSDYIDFWAVDWDYRDNTFHNRWQSFRTKKHPTLATQSEEYHYQEPGAHKILVKVVDIFGNDTNKLLEVNEP